MPNRRTLLANAGLLLSAGLGGCLGAVTGGAPAVRIADVVTDAPFDRQLEPIVSIANAEPTPNRPMRIAVGWRNGHRAPVTVSDTRDATFQRSESDDGRAWLFADDGRPDDRATFDECWVFPGPRFRDGDLRYGTLEPGETYSAESNLYAASDACLATGSYRFQSTITTSKPETPGGGKETAEWGFVLELTTA